MRLLMPLLLSFALSCSCGLAAVEDGERERLRNELPDALEELAVAQTRLTEALSVRAQALPAGVQAVLGARRTVVDEWMRKIANPAVEFPVEEADQAREALDSLRGRMDALIGLVENVGSLDERWPHAKGLPEAGRYRVFLQGEIDRGLQEIATGADVTADDGGIWQRQRRYEIILQVIESTSQTAERWPLVDRDAPAMREYLEHALQVRTAAERGLQQAMPGDDRELDRGEAILWMLDEVVQLAQTRKERLADRQILPTDPLLVSFTDGLAAEEKSLRALMAHHRAAVVDESAWQRQDEDLRRERERRGRFTGLAWEGLELDLSLTEQRRHIDELLRDTPPALAAPARARLAELDRSREVAVRALAKAVGDGARVDAIRAKGGLRVAQRNLQAMGEDLELRREREEGEQQWREHAAQPAVAAALAKLEAAWTAMAAVRDRQVEADHAAVAADVARELAEVAADEAQVAAQRSQRELEQAREQLELRRQEVNDAVENPQPKPEGDTKF